MEVGVTVTLAFLLYFSAGDVRLPYDQISEGWIFKNYELLAAST